MKFVSFGGPKRARDVPQHLDKFLIRSAVREAVAGKVAHHARARAEHYIALRRVFREPRRRSGAQHHALPTFFLGETTRHIAFRTRAISVLSSWQPERLPWLR